MRISDWSSDVCSSDLDIAPGEALFADRDIRAAVAVERGHKIALAPIARGEAVTKYGFSIGTATADIAPGEHVHSHNLATALSSDGDFRYAPPAVRAAPVPAPSRTFAGYLRPDGRAGTRNEIWILPTVGRTEKGRAGKGWGSHG